MILFLTVTGQTLLWGCFAIASSVILTIIVLRRSLRHRTDAPSLSGEQQIAQRNKYHRVNPFRWTSDLLKAGLACSLLLVLLAFNYTRYELPVPAIELPELEPIIEMNIPITTTPPPPPPPPPPPVIEPVESEEILEDEPEFVSQDIAADEPVEVSPPAALVPPPTPTPPAPPPVPVVEDPFVIVERMPLFPGCEGDSYAENRKCSDRELLQFIMKRVRYPKLAREVGVEGTAVVRFVVERDGQITNIELLRDPGAGTGAEAIRVVKTMQEQSGIWTPGKQRGVPVRVMYNLPVRFKMK